MSSITPSCVSCSKVDNLKRCAKCHTAQYCSRDCEKNDWKAHKRVCAQYAAANTARASSTPPSASNPAEPPKNLTVRIEKPFHELSTKTWLHNRPENDVHKLLIDCFRLRQDDNYKFKGDVDRNSIYDGFADSMPGFRKFIPRATGRPGLLPSWWSPAKAQECEAIGSGEGWSSLSCAMEKSDIVEHYGDPLMPMQLRMLGEQVYGSGPAGEPGASMMRLQMRMELGEFPVRFLIDRSDSM
jgi:splicing suppressor protein 51